MNIHGLRADDLAQSLRAFNCVCTGRIGVLAGGAPAPRFSLTEARLLCKLS